MLDSVKEYDTALLYFKKYNFNIININYLYFSNFVNSNIINNSFCEIL